MALFNDIAICCLEILCALTADRKPNPRFRSSVIIGFLAIMLGVKLLMILILRLDSMLQSSPLQDGLEEFSDFPGKGEARVGFISVSACF